MRSRTTFATRIPWPETPALAQGFIWTIDCCAPPRLPGEGRDPFQRRAPAGVYPRAAHSADPWAGVTGNLIVGITLLPFWTNLVNELEHSSDIRPQPAPFSSPRRRSGSGVPLLERLIPGIPAFAGMTMKNGTCANTGLGLKTSSSLCVPSSGAPATCGTDTTKAAVAGVTRALAADPRRRAFG